MTSGGSFDVVTARESGQGFWTDDGTASLRADPGGMPENLVAHSLKADGFDASEDGTGRGTPLVPIAFNYKMGAKAGSVGARDEQSPTLETQKQPAVLAYGDDISDPIVAGIHKGIGNNDGKKGRPQNAVISAMRVRRLTPKECARLQGFPDTYLDITYRGKPAADGPKYKALGNSFAVPVVRWIGQRIQFVDDLLRELAEAV